jgi:NAD(P)-dependent dehydrogenase (short-subunit alcohol dehydrogenase family)
VVVADIDREAATATVSEIRKMGGEAEAEMVDVCMEEQVVGFFGEVYRKYRRIDILVNVVGGGKTARVEEITSSEWDAMFSFNTKSCFLCSREAARRMAASGGGRIINVASLAGQTTSVLQGAHYSASKAAVIGLTRHMARELGPLGIYVNAIAPGPTSTERVKLQMTPEKCQAWISRIPLGRLGTPEDQAGVILFLASDLSNYVTGVTIDVSGGFLLG